MAAYLWLLAVVQCACWHWVMQRPSCLTLSYRVAAAWLTSKSVGHVEKSAWEIEGRKGEGNILLFNVQRPDKDWLSVLLNVVGLWRDEFKVKILLLRKGMGKGWDVCVYGRSCSEFFVCWYQTVERLQRPLMVFKNYTRNWKTADGNTAGTFVSRQVVKRKISQYI